MPSYPVRGFDNYAKEDLPTTDEDQSAAFQTAWDGSLEPTRQPTQLGLQRDPYPTSSYGQPSSSYREQASSYGQPTSSYRQPSSSSYRQPGPSGSAFPGFPPPDQGYAYAHTTLQTPGPEGTSTSRYTSAPYPSASTPSQARPYYSTTGDYGLRLGPGAPPRLPDPQDLHLIGSQTLYEDSTGTRWAATQQQRGDETVRTFAPYGSPRQTSNQYGGDYGATPQPQPSNVSPRGGRSTPAGPGRSYGALTEQDPGFWPRPEEPYQLGRLSSLYGALDPPPPRPAPMLLPHIPTDAGAGSSGPAGPNVQPFSPGRIAGSDAPSREFASTDSGIPLSRQASVDEAALTIQVLAQKWNTKKLNPDILDRFSQKLMELNQKPGRSIINEGRALERYAELAKKRLVGVSQARKQRRQKAADQAGLTVTENEARKVLIRANNANFNTVAEHAVNKRHARLSKITPPPKGAIAGRGRNVSLTPTGEQWVDAQLSLEHSVTDLTLMLRNLESLRILIKGRAKLIEDRKKQA
jgi:hypothetical protein